MKRYIKTTLDVIILKAEEYIANPQSSKVWQNNGFGNGDQYPPGGSAEHNGAENDQNGKGHN